MTDIETAALYARIGWKSLEFEERAYARGLLRRGLLRWVTDGNGNRISPQRLEAVPQHGQS